MKVRKAFRLIWYTLIAIALVVVVIVYLQVAELRKVKEQQDYIQDLIDQELFGTVEGDKNDTSDLSDIISGGLNVALKEPLFKDVVMIDSSTFEATLNGERSTYHLIGVSGDGNQEAVKTIIEGITSGVITFDAMQDRNGIKQIYLWIGDASDVNNMINLQIIRLKLCSTTYTGTSYAEAPNVKYSSKFVDASK